jgi:hypothetical protein
MKMETQATVANVVAASSSNVAAVVDQDSAAAVATVTVGLTDKVHAAPATPAAVAPVDVRTRIKQLIAERKVWQDGAFAKSNVELYALLGKCYALYFDLRGNDKDTKAAREVLNNEIAEKGYSFSEGTHGLTRLVKYVFEGIDRRRVSAYSLVLREAVAQNIKAEGIPAFITQGGGVEEIRRSKSKTAKTAKQKAELGKQAVAEQQFATFSSDTLAVLAQQAGRSAGDDLVAVVTLQADGSFVVKALVSSTTALNAARVSAYSAIVAKGDKAANDEKAQLDDLLNDAAG